MGCNCKEKKQPQPPTPYPENVVQQIKVDLNKFNTEQIEPTPEPTNPNIDYPLIED